MAEKPELIAISQYCLGGVFNFYENLLENDPENTFAKKVILLNALDEKHSSPMLRFHQTAYEIFDFSYDEQPADYASRLQHLISNRPGVVLTNFLPELAALHIYRRSKKTVVYLCHDELYYEFAIKYSFLIDIYIAHNPAMFEKLRELLPQRINDIFYIPYGIEPSAHIRENRNDDKLGLVFLARHIKTKGIADIPKINRLLIEKGISVEWTIFGDGQESSLFKAEMKEFDNVQFKKYEHKEELYEILKSQDIMVHPSSMDGLPVAMLEAMSAGVVPIVYEFNEGIGKVLKNDRGIVVPLYDYQAIASNIIRFYNDRLLLKTYSEAARSLIREHYDVKKQAKLYYKLFSQFESKKKLPQRKLINYYKGWSYHPLIPLALQKLLRTIKKGNKN